MRSTEIRGGSKISLQHMRQNEGDQKMYVVLRKHDGSGNLDHVSCLCSVAFANIFLQPLSTRDRVYYG